MSPNRVDRFTHPKRLAALTPEQRAALAKLVKAQVDKGMYRDVPDEEEE